jgi:hypothetical protein
VKTGMVQAQDIFERLIADHDKHRALLARIDATEPGDPNRFTLFEEFTFEAKGHAAAEEQALYSTALRKPPLTASARHSVAEHHEIEELLNDTAAVDVSSDEWFEHYSAARDRYLHHIHEEEEEMFPLFSQELTDEDAVYMRQVFERRKAVEKDKAEVTPEPLEEAKE